MAQDILNEDLDDEEETSTKGLSALEKMVAGVGNTTDEYMIYLIIAVNIAVAAFIIKSLLWLIKYVTNSGSNLGMNWPCNKFTEVAGALTKRTGTVSVDETSSSTPGGE
ncbi:unnamed protein product [Strongylus vulgaris]|uniref:Uncharacterized protein n=1 Tax=Strongylus vulgaris TaxID=40348 RepID=A0A3P7ITU9_STRVU|nr:unnamed protein product [Strongylus vulgaris]